MGGWKEGKEQHVKLADIAAAAYKEYGSSNSATLSYMRYEEEIIRKAAASLVMQRDRALDLGCGEGRISFLLADLFGEVTGYDMSSEMVRVADRRRLLLSRGNEPFRATG